MSRTKKTKSKPATQPAALVHLEGGEIHGDLKVVGHAETVIIQPPPPAESHSARFHRRLPAYLQHLIKQVEVLDLSTLARNAADEDADQAPPLAELYTSLDVLCGRERMDCRSAAEAPERQGERQSATAFVSQHPRVALLGDPGSGKSTFANYLALVLAGEWLRREKLDLAALGLASMETVHLERLGQDWQAGPLLPVRVLLRDFVAQRTPHGTPAEQLWAFVQREMGPALKDFLEPLQAHLRDHGGILILDGYDEVPETRLDPSTNAAKAPTLRDFVKEAVRDFQKHFPGVRILLTSRTYAYQDQPATDGQPARQVRLPGFDVTVLAPFSRGQMELFVDGWYAHRARRKAKSRLSEDATGRAALLKDAIRRRLYLEELVRRPLLLTLAAALHDWNQAKLPDSREELYRQSVDLLLYRWEGRKQTVDKDGRPVLQDQSAAAWFQVPQAAILNAFEEMAFKAHRDQPDRKGAADIKQEAVVAALMNMKAGPDLPQARIIEYIQDRAGLLLDRGNQVYCFPHRTFQEYLAACHLTRLRWPRELLGLVRGDVERWREAVLLAGAIAARMPSVGWQLAQKLCSPLCGTLPPWPEGDVQWWLTLLAGQLLVETGIGFGTDLDEDEAACRQHIVKALALLVDGGHLPPVDRAAAGIALGKLGDPRPGVGLKDGLPDLVFEPEEPLPPLPSQRSFKLAEDGTELVIEHPYRISRYPVTVAQFAPFKAVGYDEKNPDAPRWWGKGGWQWKVENQITGPEDSDPVFQTPNHPRVGVSWYEATAFCAWLAEQLTQKIRLPNEAEWEQAARWDGKKTDDRYFPWGGSKEDDPDFAQHCNCPPTGLGHTSAVGLFPSGKAGCGALDMAGNAWEWCENLFQKDREWRVLRGGSWANCGPASLSCSSRYFGHPYGRYDDRGFRCVWCVGGSAPR